MTRVERLAKLIIEVRAKRDYLRYAGHKEFRDGRFSQTTEFDRRADILCVRLNSLAAAILDERDAEIPDLWAEDRRFIRNGFTI